MSPRTRTRRGPESQSQSQSQSQPRKSSTPRSTSRPVANFTELNPENILEGSQKRTRISQRLPSEHSGSDDDSDEEDGILVGGPPQPISARFLSRLKKVLVVEGLPRDFLEALALKRSHADVDDGEDDESDRMVKRRKTDSYVDSVEGAAEDPDDDLARYEDALAGEQLLDDLDGDATNEIPDEDVAPAVKAPTRGRGGRRGGRWGRGGRGSRRGANLRRTASQNTPTTDGYDGGVSLSIEGTKAEDIPGRLLDVPALIPDKASSRGSSRLGRSTRIAEVHSEDEPEDVITEDDLPPPFLEKPPTPSRGDCQDEADWLVQKQYAPMSDPQALIRALTKLPPSTRSTENLYQLALNTQKVLRSWQDQYLQLDARTAPHSHPPKKPATGGRLPIDPAIWEDMKESELWNYKFDPKKAPGEQDPYGQRLDSELVGGRELRIRRQRDIGDAGSDDDEANLSAAATGPGAALAAGERRKRKTTQRFENTIEIKTRKRNLEGTPEVEVRRKRGRPAMDKTASGLLAVPSRLTEVIREGSVFSSTSDDFDAGREGVSPGPTKHRGRPVGIKNSRPRSDKGIKKGPRNMSRSPLPASAADADHQASATAAAGFKMQQGTLQDPFVDEASRFPDHRNMRTQQAADLLHYMDDIPPEAMSGAMQPPSDISRSGKLPIGPTGAQPPTGEPKRKQRVKSEKRSASMTLWWASRKAAQEEKRRQEQQEAGERWQADQRRQMVEQHEARQTAAQEQRPVIPPPQPTMPQPMHTYGAPLPPQPPPTQQMQHHYAVYAPHPAYTHPPALPPPPPPAVAPPVSAPHQQPSGQSYPHPPQHREQMSPRYVEAPPHLPIEQHHDFGRRPSYQSWHAMGQPPRRFEPGAFGRISLPDVASSRRNSAGSPTSPARGSHATILPSPTTGSFQVSMPPAQAPPQVYAQSGPLPPFTGTIQLQPSQQPPPGHQSSQPSAAGTGDAKKAQRGPGKFQALQPKPSDAAPNASIPPQIAPAPVVAAANSENQQAPNQPPTPTTAGPMPPQGNGPVLAPAPPAPATAPTPARIPSQAMLPHQHQVFAPYQQQLLPPQHRPSLGAPFDPLPHQQYSVPPPPPVSSHSGTPQHQRKDSGPRRRHTPSLSSTSQSWQALTTMQIQTHQSSTSTTAPPLLSTIGQIFDPVSGSMRDRPLSESRMRVQEGQGQSPTIRTNPTRFHNYDMDHMRQRDPSDRSQPQSRRESQSHPRPPSAGERRSQSTDPARAALAPAPPIPPPPPSAPGSRRQSHSQSFYDGRPQFFGQQQQQQQHQQPPTGRPMDNQRMWDPLQAFGGKNAKIEGVKEWFKRGSASPAKG